MLLQILLSLLRSAWELIKASIFFLHKNLFVLELTQHRIKNVIKSRSEMWEEYDIIKNSSRSIPINIRSLSHQTAMEDDTLKFHQPEVNIFTIFWIFHWRLFFAAYSTRSTRSKYNAIAFYFVHSFMLNEFYVYVVRYVSIGTVLLVMMAQCIAIRILGTEWMFNLDSSLLCNLEFCCELRRLHYFHLIFISAAMYSTWAWLPLKPHRYFFLLLFFLLGFIHSTIQDSIDSSIIIIETMRILSVLKYCKCDR